MKEDTPNGLEIQIAQSFGQGTMFFTPKNLGQRQDQIYFLPQIALLRKIILAIIIGKTVNIKVT